MSDGYIDDEQLEEKKKILTLGDQAAFEQQAEITRKKNEAIIQHLKKQNLDLQQQYVNLKRENSTVSYNVSQAKKEELQNRLVELRKQEDVLNTAKQQKSREKRKLSEKYDEMDRMNPMNNARAAQVRNLENQLDKIIIKYNEAQSIHKTYEQILKRLHDERSNFDAQLEQMEEIMKQKKEDYEELLLMQKSAHAARETARDELKRVVKETDTNRRDYDADITKKTLLLQQKLEQKQQLEHEERKRQQMNSRSEDLGNEETQARRYGLAVGASSADQQVEQLQERMAHDEDSFRRLREATGDDDINKVIQKFLVQSDYFKEVEDRRKATERRLERAKKGRSDAQHELEEASTLGVERVSAKFINEEQQKQLKTLKNKEEDTKRRFFDAKQLKTDVKEGIRLLCTKVGVAVTDPDSQPTQTVVEEGGKTEELEEDARFIQERLLAEETYPSWEDVDQYPLGVFERVRRCVLFLRLYSDPGYGRDKEEKNEEEVNMVQDMMRRVIAASGDKTLVPEGNARIHFGDEEADEGEFEEEEDVFYGQSSSGVDEQIKDRDTMKKEAADLVKLAEQRAKRTKKEEDS